MKKNRQTLTKKIAAAPTFAQKWQMALIGGAPMSKIEQLSNDAAALRPKSAHGKEWQDDAVARLKQKFADLLFPALMKDDTAPFEELTKAMADFRKYGFGNRKKLTARQEASRFLRLAIMNLAPEDRVSINCVLRALDKLNASYSDESHVRRVMREIDIWFLKPGQHCQWRIGGKLVRDLIFNSDETLTNRGLTRENLEMILGEKHYIEYLPPDARTNKH